MVLGSQNHLGGQLLQALASVPLSYADSEALL